MSQQQMTNQQRITIAAKRLAYIKGECHQAVHPTVIRDRVRELIELLEWLLIGEISNAQPHVVPGVPAGIHEDPSKIKVEFTSGPGAVAAAQAAVAQIPGYHADPFSAPVAPPTPVRGPVNNGDVNFIPGPPPGSPGAVGGQTVEYFGGPGQGNGQHVEFFGGPGAPAQPPAPVSNQPAQIVPNPPTLTTEAGGPVAPIPGRPANGAPAVGAGLGLFPGFPGFPSAAEPPPGAPRTAEEARTMIPIPLAE
jgi:hypothetical protein